MTEHTEFIDRLGKTRLVAAELGVKQNLVCMWRQRGVSWRWRAAVADLAGSKGVTIPKGFLDPAKQPQRRTA